MELVCVRCNTVQHGAYNPVCGRCGSLTNPRYRLEATKLRRSDNAFARFADLLPVRDAALLPADTGYTPLVDARNLGRKLGLPHLYLKNETVLPTGTTKYRMAAVALPYLYENDVAHFCTSSTGNSSTAYLSRIGRTPDLAMTLFTASAFRNRINHRPPSRVKHFILEGASFAEAFKLSGLYARSRGYTSERGFFNPGRREGLKLAYFEATEQAPRPIDCYVQAVSSAMGVYGTYSGAGELLALGRIPHLPKLICVQQSSCAPMAHAWFEGAESIAKRHILKHPRGIAHAILRGDPTGVYPYVRKIVDESGGRFVSVSDDEIRAARRMLMDEEGIEVCGSAAAAVASVVQLVRVRGISAEETVMINLTGSDRPSQPVADGTVLEKLNGVWRSDKDPSTVLPAEE